MSSGNLIFEESFFGLDDFTLCKCLKNQNKMYLFDSLTDQCII